MPLEPIPGYVCPDYCDHPEHNPPTHQFIPDGMRLRHKCPRCGHETYVYPPERVTMAALSPDMSATKPVKEGE